MAYPNPIGVYWHTSDGTSVCHLLELPTVNGWSEPICCNLDGSIIYGNTDSGPARWDNGAITLLAPNPNVTAVVFCSQDGSVVTGVLAGGGVTDYGYWTSGGTVSQGQLAPAAEFTSFLFGNPGARTTSDDGSIIIGKTSGGVTYWTNGVATVLEPSLTASCSKDGTMLVGIGPSSDNPCYWLSGTRVNLTFFDDQFFTFAKLCSGDKTRIYGSAVTGAQCYWDSLATVGAFGHGVIHLLSDPGINANVFAISDTNGIAVGSSNLSGTLRAIKWNDTAATTLPQAAGWTGSFANFVSADGSVIAGGSSAALAASFWDASNTPFTLFVPPGPPGYTASATIGISKDGSLIFGTLSLPPPPPPTWIITSPLNGASESGIGNLWMDSSFVDFSDPSLLAGFVNSDGSWIDVGYYGQLPTGTSPLNYLTVQTGNTPDDFVFGYGQTGSQSSWQVATTGIDPTTAAPYPINLMVDECGPSTSSAWVISASTSGEAADAGIGDVWMNEGFLDFSDPAIRAKFVATDGTWKYLGVYGELPTGSSPLNWLRIQTGNAATDILTGYGLNSTQTAWSLLNLGMDPVTGQPYAAMSLDVCPPFVTPIVPGPGDGSSSSSSSSSSTHAGATGQTGGDKIRVDEDLDQWQKYLAWRDKQWRKRQAQKGILVNEPNIPSAPVAPTPVVAPKPKPDPVRVPDRVVDQWQQQMASAHPLLPAAPPAPFNSPPPGKPLPLTQLPSQLDALRRQMKIKI